MREGHDGSALFHFFDYCYFNRDTQAEPLRRREAVMLLAINWIEILVINEAKNVNKHSPIYNCLLFIWASFYVGLGPKFSLVKSASVDSKLPHQWSRYEISQTNFLTIQEIQNTFIQCVVMSLQCGCIGQPSQCGDATYRYFIQNNNLPSNYSDEKIR